MKWLEKIGAGLAAIGPLIMREKGIGEGSLAAERLDSAVSAVVKFLIPGAIMMVATGVLFAQGKGIVQILDMSATPKPVAGRFAVAC